MFRQLAIALAVGAALGFGAAHVFSNAKASPPATEVLSENGVIRFIVDGQEQARLDSAGLTVKGNLSYSGSFVDSVVYPPANAATTGDAR